MNAHNPALSIAHLINPRAAGDLACFACATLFNHAPHWASHTCIVAQHPDDEPRAALLGLPTHHRLPPGATALMSRSTQLRRIWRTIGAAPDLLVVWPGIPMPPRAPGIRTISAERLDIRPGPVDLDLISATARQDARAAWGVPDGARVLAASAQPANACDAWAATYLGGVLTLAKPPMWVVIPAGADQADRALRFAERHDHRWGVIFDDAPLPFVLAGADAVIHAISPRCDGAGTPPSADGLAWAAALALPIVAQASPVIDPDAPHLAAAGIVPPGNHRALAHALTKAMLDDTAPQRQDIARTTIKRSDPAAFARRAHATLQSLAPGPLTPALAPAQ